MSEEQQIRSGVNTIQPAADRISNDSAVSAASQRRTKPSNGVYSKLHDI